jgi:hypothetical protein
MHNHRGVLSCGRTYLPLSIHKISPRQRFFGIQSTMLDITRICRTPGFCASHLCIFVLLGSIRALLGRLNLVLMFVQCSDAVALHFQSEVRLPALCDLNSVIAALPL